MKTLNDSLQERLNDPEFKVAYEYENIVQNIAYKAELKTAIKIFLLVG